MRMKSNVCTVWKLFLLCCSSSRLSWSRWVECHIQIETNSQSSSTRHFLCSYAALSFTKTSSSSSAECCHHLVFSETFQAEGRFRGSRRSSGGSWGSSCHFRLFSCSTHSFGNISELAHNGRQSLITTLISASEACGKIYCSFRTFIHSKTWWVAINWRHNKINNFEYST